MPRATNSVKSRRRRKKILKYAKGYYGATGKRYRLAKQAVMKAWSNAYRDRKARKREFRKLWIARINAAARNHGLSYSRFMHGLKLANVEINRKMLADLAVNDPQAFATLVETAKQKLN